MKNFKFLSLLFFLLFHGLLYSQVLRKRTVMLMGSRFDITIVDKDSLSAENNIDKVIAEVTRIENLISEWKPETQISQVNQNAGIRAVKVDKEVFELTKRALWFSELTDGAFDISIAATDKIWKFDGSMTDIPSEAQIKKSIEKVGYKNIVLDSINSTIFLKYPGMKIGFGATGKGYAADKGKELMQSLGIQSGIVNASGDMNVWGLQPNGKPWKIGITDPLHPDEILKKIKLTDAAIVTSGSYEKFVMFDHKRYSHIINPKTGWPASELINVTILGSNAEMANGFSTSIMVLGREKGLKLLKRFPDFKYLIVDVNGKIYKN